MISVVDEVSPFDRTILFFLEISSCLTIKESNH
jgi:hypothetical protein